jgi:hypothetical protein
MKWRLKQLFPFTYRAHYWIPQPDGTLQPHLAVFNMWFGWVFHHEDVELAQ